MVEAWAKAARAPARAPWWERNLQYLLPLPTLLLLLLFVVRVALTVTRIRLQSVAASFLVHVGYTITLFSVMWFATDHFRHMEKLK